jgi:transposase
VQPATVVPIAGTPLLTEALWAKLAPLLPVPANKGRPRGETRPLLAGLLWMMHHGAGWRALPREHGSWHTLYSRYRLWVTTGVWAQITEALREYAPHHSGT